MIAMGFIVLCVVVFMYCALVIASDDDDMNKRG